MGRPRYLIIEQFQIPSDEGMDIVNSMLHAKYIALRSGKADTWASIGVRHSLKHGRPYHWSATDVALLNSTLHTIASELAGIKVSAFAITQEQNPWMYGDTVADQLMSIRHIIRLPYIFTTRMGKNEQWRLNRISLKTSSVYNRFDRDDIRTINRILSEIVSVLTHIELLQTSHNSEPEDLIDIVQ